MGAAHKNDLNLETYSAIWLNSSSHTSKETSKAQQKLRISINHLKIVINVKTIFDLLVQKIDLF